MANSRSVLVLAAVFLSSLANAGDGQPYHPSAYSAGPGPYDGDLECSRALNSTGLVYAGQGAWKNGNLCVPDQNYGKPTIYCFRSGRAGADRYQQQRPLPMIHDGNSDWPNALVRLKVSNGQSFDLLYDWQNPHPSQGFATTGSTSAADPADTHVCDNPQALNCQALHRGVVGTLLPSHDVNDDDVRAAISLENSSRISSITLPPELSGVKRLENALNRCEQLIGSLRPDVHAAIADKRALIARYIAIHNPTSTVTDPGTGAAMGAAPGQSPPH